jgi:cytoskeletal protein CcmA (bactofilin family)
MNPAAFTTASAAHLDDSDNVLPEKTPLFVGQGVVVEGLIRYTGTDRNARLVILGEVHGDIETTGILQIAQGATVHAANKIECAEIIVAGQLLGDGVKVRAGLIDLKPTAVVRVDTLCLPPGGIVQARGSLLNAKMDMSDEYASLAVPVVEPAAVAATTTLTQVETAPAKVALVAVTGVAPAAVLPGDEIEPNDKAIVSTQFSAVGFGGHHRD